jgi:hypothetical protein
MKRVDPDIHWQLAVIVKSYPHVFTWLNSWYMDELKALPRATSNTAFAQGRCLVLQELVTLLQEAPETAKPQGR